MNIVSIVSTLKKVNLARKIATISPELILLIIPVVQFILEEKRKKNATTRR